MPLAVTVRASVSLLVALAEENSFAVSSFLAAVCTASSLVLSVDRALIWSW